MQAFTFEVREDSIEIAWPDGASGRFSWLWLADNEPSAFHPQTEERLFDLVSVPDDLQPLSVEPAEDAIRVWWPGRDSDSLIRCEWLRAHLPGKRRSDPADIEPVLWGGSHGPVEVPRRSAAEVVESDAAFRAWLEETVRYGLSIVEDLDDRVDAGIELAQRIGFLRQTNFGLTFEVVSKPDPNNLAYTPVALPLHTDLPNQEVPPGYQFLHCIANEAEGGGSIFCDGFAAALDLKRHDAEAFRVLSEVAIPFRFHDRDYDIRSRFPVIGCDDDGTVREIRFNAHIVDTVDLSGLTLSAFYRAYRAFMRMTRDPAYRHTLRLRAGEMVVFDNRRTLHGREAFDPATGYRHLNGCYVDRGEFLSRIRILARGNGEPY